MGRKEKPWVSAFQLSSDLFDKTVRIFSFERYGRCNLHCILVDGKFQAPLVMTINNGNHWARIIGLPKDDLNRIFIEGDRQSVIMFSQIITNSDCVRAQYHFEIVEMPHEVSAKDWLERVIRDAHAETSLWPEWKGSSFQAFDIDRQGPRR